MKDLHEFAGADSANWTGTFPAVDWATEILDTAQETAVLYSRCRHYFGDRKIHVPKHVHPSTVNWQSSVGSDVSATDYDFKSIALDPVRYRGVIPIDIDSIKENPFDIAADVKQSINDAIAAKMESLISGQVTAADFTGLTNTVVSNKSSGTATTIESGDLMTLSHLKTATKKVKANSNLYADTAWLPPAAWQIMIGKDQFYNAATFGDRSVVESGRIGRWLGMDIFVSNNVPTFGASGNAKFDVEGFEALVFNSSGWLATLLSEDLELKVKPDDDAYEMDFYFNFKFDVAEADSNYGCVVVAENASS